MSEGFNIDSHTLRVFIAARKVEELRQIFDEHNIVDMSELVKKLDLEEQLFLFKTLKTKITAQVFSYLSYDQQASLIEVFTGPEIQKMLDYLYDDDILDFIEEMPANVVHYVLENASTKQRNEINRLLSYVENSAGSIMSSKLVMLKESDTIKEAIEKIRKQGTRAETIDDSYVVDSQKELKGIIGIRTIVCAEEHELIGDLMQTDLVAVKANDDQEEVAKIFEKYDITVVPVVNSDNCLVGIITVDDIIDVIHEEATEDIHKMGGITPMENKDYLDTNILDMVKSRFPWLVILVLISTITVFLLAQFQEFLVLHMSVVIFLPLIMDIVGNTGSQSSIMIMRAMALNDLNLKDLFKVLFKELGVAFICGIMIGAFEFMFAYIIFNMNDVLIPVTIALSIMITMMIANVIGAMLPMIASKIKMDPSTMSGSIVTSIIDVLTISIYILIAINILK